MSPTPIEQLKREALAMSEPHTVYRWQFIEHRFVPSQVFLSATEAWAYVKSEIASGKDMSRFRVEPCKMAGFVPDEYSAAARESEAA